MTAAELRALIAGATKSPWVAEYEYDGRRTLGRWGWLHNASSQT